MSDLESAHPSQDCLSKFLLGQLSMLERGQVEQHILLCGDCCSALEAVPDDALVRIARLATEPLSTDTTVPGLDDTRPLVSPDAEPPPELEDHARYRVVALLGSGGMGTVYKAEHRLMQRTVALKVVHRQLVSRPEAVQRFRTEVKAAAQLAHPNIVMAHDAEQAGELHFLVMEWLDGVSLDELVDDVGPLEVVDACEIVRQAALGLQHAHEHGMVHRDLKPQNIMLVRAVGAQSQDRPPDHSASHPLPHSSSIRHEASPDLHGWRTEFSQVKILDFGLARFASEVALNPESTNHQRLPNDGMITYADAIVGTPSYMAPEQFSDPRAADVRSDVYSLGCTFYYLLTGRAPFARDALLKRLVQASGAKPTPIRELRPQLPAEVANVVAAMLAPNARDRYREPRQVVQVLESLLDGLRTSPADWAARSSPPARTAMVHGWVTRCATWIPIGAVLASVVLAILLVGQPVANGPVEENAAIATGRPVVAAVNSSVRPTMHIGTNPEGTYDWSPAWVFTDVFKNSRDWISHEIDLETGRFVWDSEMPVETDPRGWPTRLSSRVDESGRKLRQALGTFTLAGLSGHYPAGLYRVEWDGRGTYASGAVKFDGDVVRVTDHGATPEGRNFASLHVEPMNQGIYLRIEEIDPADPIRNLNIWMPDYESQSFVGQRDWSLEADFSPFHPLFVERLRPFQTLRFRQMAGTGVTGTVSWNDGRSLDDARQAHEDRVAAGVAVEYLIQLANETGADAWFTMPHAANDDFVRRFATVVRDKLDGQQKVYLEWANEIWYRGPGANIAPWIKQQLERPENQGIDFYEFAAQQIDRDFQIWQEVFAGEERRLVRVVGGLLPMTKFAERIIAHLDGNFDAVAIGTSFGPDQEETGRFGSETTVDEVVDIAISSIPTILSYAQQHAELVRRYEVELGRDLQLLVSDGGINLPATGKPFESAYIAAVRSSRMYFAHQLLINGLNDLGIDLFVDSQYTMRIPGLHADNGGSLHFQDQPIDEAHKYRALLDAIRGVSIDANNQRPTISALNDIYLRAGTPRTLAFTIGDAETQPGEITVIADARDSQMIPAVDLIVGGSGSARTLTLTATGSAADSTTVSVLVADEQCGTALASFRVTIVPELSTPLAVDAN